MPSWRHIRTEIQKTSDRYLVAVSGGIDSMFLLDFIRRTNVYIEVVHFDHGIREDSSKDYELIEQYTKAHGIVCWHSTSQTLTKQSNEIDARKQRWEFIESVANRQHFKYIVTAHHADDQIENVLIRLMRGDPHDSLCMHKFVEKNDHVRYKPLLDVRKQDILCQAEARGLTWNDDSTNQETQYDRNFIRNIVLPMLASRTNVYQSILTGVQKSLL